MLLDTSCQGWLPIILPFNSSVCIHILSFLVWYYRNLLLVTVNHACERIDWYYLYLIGLLQGSFISEMTYLLHLTYLSSIDSTSHNIKNRHLTKRINLLYLLLLLLLIFHSTPPLSSSFPLLNIQPQNIYTPPMPPVPSLILQNSIKHTEIGTYTYSSVVGFGMVRYITTHAGKMLHSQSPFPSWSWLSS